MSKLDEFWTEVTMWSANDLYLKGKPTIKSLIEVIRAQQEIIKNKHSALEFSKFVLTDRECSSDQTGVIFYHWSAKMRDKIDQALAITVDVEKILEGILK